MKMAPSMKVTGLKAVQPEKEHASTQTKLLTLDNGSVVADGAREPTCTQMAQNTMEIGRKI